MQNKKIRLQMKLFPDMQPEDVAKIIEAEEKRKNYNKMSVYQKFKYDNNYRKSENTEKCQNCKNIYCEIYHNKKYYKCLLLGKSRGQSTDIRLKCICDRYKRG